MPDPLEQGSAARRVTRPKTTGTIAAVAEIGATTLIGADGEPPVERGEADRAEDAGERRVAEVAGVGRPVAAEPRRRARSS